MRTGPHETRAAALKEQLLTVIRDGCGSPDDPAFQAVFTEFVELRRMQAADPVCGYTVADYLAEAEALDAAILEQAAAAFVAELRREHGEAETRDLVERNRGQLAPDFQAAIDMHLGGGPVMH